MATEIFPLDNQTCVSGSDASFEFSPFPLCQYDWNAKRILLHNVAMHTPKIEAGYVQDDGSTRMFRSTLHQFIVGPSGQFKTTILMTLKKAYETPEHRVLYVDDITPSAIKGGLDDKTRRPLPPLAYLCKGGSLLLDECNLNPVTQEQIIQAMLPILENEISSRKIGFKPKEEIESADVTVKQGLLEFRNLKCNHILATMKNLRKNRKEFMDALVSRTVPIYLNWTRKDMEILIRNPSLLFHKIDFHPEPRVIIDNKTYWALFGIAEKYDELPDKFVPRTTEDLLRVYAVTKTLDLDLFDYIIQGRMRFCWKEKEDES